MGRDVGREGGGGGGGGAGGGSGFLKPLGLGDTLRNSAAKIPGFPPEERTLGRS